MDQSTALDIISEACGLGYRRLHLTGGEPFLWKPLFSVIEKALAEGYESVFINTNGTLLTPAVCGELRAISESISLSVSLQGPPELHDRVRGKGSWQRASRGIESALKNNIPLAVFTTVSRSLLPMLPRFCEEVLTDYPEIQGIALIQLIRVKNDLFDLSAELLRPEDFLTMVKSAALLNLHGHRLHILENPLASAAAALMGMPWIPPSPPLHRSGRITVMADGSPGISHSGSVLSVKYTPGILASILNSDDYAAMCSPDDYACTACRHFTTCRANGMLRPSEWFRDMGDIEPYCARVMNTAAGHEP
jgi:MoaA/NifB/PqqE/SkfB family radical SAM enzyme